MKDCLKIIAVSDSHGDREVLNWISQTEYDADFFLHLGDSELTPAALYQYVAVAGNRDMPNLFPVTRRIKTVTAIFLWNTD